GDGIRDFHVTGVQTCALPIFGKGYLEGTQTKGGFVPEQHTDYIFTTVGEEWGFVGAVVVIILFVCLLLRIIYLAENQKSRLSRRSEERRVGKEWRSQWRP